MFEIPADVLLCCCDDQCESFGDCCSDYASCCVGSSATTTTTTAAAASARERDDGDGGDVEADVDADVDGCDGLRPGVDASVRGGDGALLLTRYVARRAKGEGNDGGEESAGAFRDACVEAFDDDDVRAALRRFKRVSLNRV